MGIAGASGGGADRVRGLWLPRAFDTVPGDDALFWRSTAGGLTVARRDGVPDIAITEPGWGRPIVLIDPVMAAATPVRPACRERSPRRS